MASNVEKGIASFLKSVSRYYVPVEKPVVEGEKPPTPSEIFKKCEWISGLGDDKITTCNPEELRAFAKAQRGVCETEMTFISIKTNLFATSLFTFVIGMMMAMIPLSITTVFVPLVIWTMATSLITMIGYIVAQILGDAIVKDENEKIVDENREIFQRLIV